MHAFGGVFKKYFEVSVNKAPFYKLIPPLKEITQILLNYPVNKKQEYWILFDDLDTHFNIKKDADNQKLMELVRISKMYNNEVFKNNKAKILIFLRDDIRDFIISKYADSAKIFNSYEITLNWYNHVAYTSNIEQNIPLRQLANKRIQLNFKKNNIPFAGDPWDSLFASNDYYGKSSFKYVLDFTFYRPRDIITFLSTMSKNYYTYPIDKKTVKEMLSNFVRVNISEVKSELKLFFSEKEIDLIFKSVFKYIIDEYGVCLSKLKVEIEKLNFSMDASSVLEILLNYSLIIPMDKSGTLYFNYRDNTDIRKVDIMDLNISLPKCIYHYYKKIN
jgi:hypothetical protein